MSEQVFGQTYIMIDKKIKKLPYILVDAWKANEYAFSYSE